MDGEKQLQQLEREEAIATLTGKAMSEENRQKLLRAKTIEEKELIQKDELEDPVFRAAHKRVTNRLGRPAASREHRLQKEIEKITGQAPAPSKSANPYADPYRFSPEASDLERAGKKRPLKAQPGEEEGAAADSAAPDEEGAEQDSTEPGEAEDTESGNEAATASKPEKAEKAAPDPNQEAGPDDSHPGTEPSDNPETGTEKPAEQKPQAEKSPEEAAKATDKPAESKPAKAGQEIAPPHSAAKRNAAETPAQTAPKNSAPSRKPPSPSNKKSGKQKTPGQGGGQTEKKNRLNFISVVFLIVVALAFDLLSVIPIVFSLIAWIVFPFWFWILDVGFINPKRLVAPIVSFIIELIPAISAIPSITLAIIIVIVMVKFEDKTGIKLPSPGSLTKAAK